jgi:hypothetical protein
MATKKRKIQTSWTPARDKKLETMQSAGKTAADIAKVLGTSRNAVIGRSRRLRGIVYQSDIDSWTRANARRSAEAHKRSLIRRDLQGKIVAEMLKSIASGVPPEGPWSAPSRPAPTGGRSASISACRSRLPTRP